MLRSLVEALVACLVAIVAPDFLGRDETTAAGIVFRRVDIWE